ncbi:type I restriction enzyme S subunit [Pseudomonas alcaligenes]|nr:type I restriction enzyme S subunit [Pseudomonas alcaligenes]
MTGFPIVFLKDIAHIEREIVQAANIEAGERYVGLENINSRGIVCGVVEAAAGQIASAKFRFTADHILYGKLRPYLSKIALPDFSGVCSTDILPLKPTELVDKRYLWHCLRQPSLVELANSRATGANLPRLSPKQLEDFEVPLPKLAEQKRIAAILDKADALRAKRRKALEQLDALAQAIFIEMFGEPSSESERWPVIRFGELPGISFRNGVSPSSEASVESKVLTLSAITGTCFDHTQVKVGKYRSHPGEMQSVNQSDLLICRGNGNSNLVGKGYFPKVSEPDVYFPDTMIAVRVGSEKMLPLFLEFLWGRSFIRTQINAKARTTNGTFKINQKALEDISLICPPLDLQQNFSSRLVQINRQKVILAAQGNELDALFSSLQHRAFRGEL